MAFCLSGGRSLRYCSVRVLLNKSCQWVSITGGGRQTW